MSWKRETKAAGSIAVGCLNDLVMWIVIAPMLGVFLALASVSGDPGVILGAVVLGVLVFGLYLLASWNG